MIGFEELINKREDEIEQQRRKNAADEKAKLEATWKGVQGVLFGALCGFFAFIALGIVVGLVNWANGTKTSNTLMVSILITFVILGAIVCGYIWYNDTYNSKKTL